MTWLATALHVAKRVTNWYGMVCGTGGERISRHNAFRDAIFDTAASAPLKEERALLPGNNRRPADLLLRHWCGGRDAALDVTITQMYYEIQAEDKTCSKKSVSSTIKSRARVKSMSKHRPLFTPYLLSIPNKK